jgi:phasin family protein
MAKTTPTDFIASFQNVFGDLQSKATAAYEKSTSTLGEVNEFTKGNVEAVVESGKILASGLQDLGATMVADSRSAFETLTAEVKDLAAVKTPAEFFSLQGALARKNFDTAVAQASKSTEAFLKLANEVMTPISGRVTLAVEKVSKAA